MQGNKVEYEYTLVSVKITLVFEEAELYALVLYWNRWILGQYA